MSWTNPRLLMLFAASMLAGLLAAQLLHPAPQARHSAPEPQDWQLPALPDAAATLAAAEQLARRQPWGDDAAEPELSPEQQAAEQARLAAEAADAARAAEAEARRRASQWRFVGTLRAAGRETALFLSGAGELRQRRLGEPVAEPWTLQELHRDRAVLVRPAEPEEAGQPATRTVRLFRDTVFDARAASANNNESTPP